MKKVLRLLFLLVVATTFTFAQIPTDGLVGYWPFNGNANDESGNGNDGTVIGATLTADRFGNTISALRFNGNDYISVPTSPSLESPDSSFSSSAWIKIVGSGWFPILSKSDNSSYPMYDMMVSRAGGYFGGCSYLCFNSVGNEHAVPYSFQSGIWYFVCTTWNGSRILFYVNDSLIGGADYVGEISKDSKPLLIGIDTPGATEFTVGDVDEVRIYNRALNVVEISTLYHEGNFGSQRISGTIFNDVNANGLFDGNDSTLAGWRVLLENLSGTVIDSQLTDSTGKYELFASARGNYTVSEVPPTGWIQTLPTGLGSYTVTVSDSETVTGKDFGNTRTYRYIGKSTGKWSDSTSWAGGVPPSSDKFVSIPTGVVVTVDSLPQDTVKALRIESGGTLQFLPAVSKLNVMRTLQIDKNAILKFPWATDTIGIICYRDWVNRGTIDPIHSTIKFAGNQPKLIASDGGVNKFYKLEIAGDSTSAIGNLTVQNKLELQYNLGLRDTLFIRNSSPGAIVGQGIIPSGTIRRDIDPNQPGLYRFESDSTYIRFNNTDYLSLNIGVTTYPATNPLTVSTKWNIVGGVVDTSANTIKVQTSIKKSRWAIGIPRLRTGTGTGKVAQDPWLVNRVYAVSLSGKTDSTVTLSLRYEPSEVPSGLSENALVLMQFETIEIPKTVEAGWNIVSVPVDVFDAQKSVLFPSPTSSAFEFQGSYISRDTLCVGIGYWLKFSNANTVNLVGIPVMEDTFNVLKGWNLIGSISSAISSSYQIGSIPSGIRTSPLYRYSGGYSTTDTIYPGFGYWMKVSEDGQLILSSQSVFKEIGRIKIVPTSEQPPPPPIGEITDEIPKTFALEQNYPNPFNPSTTIEYDLPKEVFVTLKIFNLLGQEVTTLVNDLKQAGRYRAEWKSSNIASGIYYSWFKAGDYCVTKKLLLLK